MWVRYKGRRLADLAAAHHLPTDMWGDCALERLLRQHRLAAVAPPWAPGPRADAHERARDRAVAAQRLANARVVPDLLATRLIGPDAAVGAASARSSSPTSTVDLTAGDGGDGGDGDGAGDSDVAAASAARQKRPRASTTPRRSRRNGGGDAVPPHVQAALSHLRRPNEVDAGVSGLTLPRVPPGSLLALSSLASRLGSGGAGTGAGAGAGGGAGGGACGGGACGGALWRWLRSKSLPPLWEPGKQFAPAGSLPEATLEKVPAPFQVLKFS